MTQAQKTPRAGAFQLLQRRKAFSFPRCLGEILGRVAPQVNGHLVASSAPVGYSTTVSSFGKKDKVLLRNIFVVRCSYN